MNRSHLSVYVPELLCALVLLAGGGSIAQAQDKAPATEQSSPSSGDIQERGLLRAPLGTVAPAIRTGPVGFYCLQSEGKCYCDRTTRGDCDLMKAYVCAPGSYTDSSPLDGECYAKTR
jgi:hypothetical protein